MSRSGREALPDVPEGWKALPDVRQLSSGPPECVGGSPGGPGVVRKHSRMFGRGQKALPDICEWWGPSRVSESSREMFPNVREWLEGPPDVRKWSDSTSDVQGWSGGSPHD